MMHCFWAIRASESRAFEFNYAPLSSTFLDLLPLFLGLVVSPPLGVLSWNLQLMFDHSDPGHRRRKRNFQLKTPCKFSTV